jgi:hypothetical protein
MRTGFGQHYGAAGVEAEAKCRTPGTRPTAPSPRMIKAAARRAANMDCAKIALHGSDVLLRPCPAGAQVRTLGSAAAAR